MPKLTRRSVLGGLLAGGAYTTVAPILSRTRHMALAQDVPEPYPTIFIHLNGGLDPRMHWDARVGPQLRNVQEADIRETAGGIRWYEKVLAPLTPHMEDMTLIRNVSTSTGHVEGNALWWSGEDDPDIAPSATPWPNYLASELSLIRHAAAPSIVTHSTYNPDRPIDLSDLTGVSNRSPTPAGASQRVRDAQAFSDSLDVVTGLPPFGTQSRVYAAVEQMDRQLYSPTVQGRTLGDFLAANTQATDLLAQPPPQLWPPADSTMEAFDLTQAHLTAKDRKGNPTTAALLAMGFEAVRLRLSHVVFLQGHQTSYDTHNGHDRGQRANSRHYMPVIANLLSALKATPSPIDPSLSMLDTTHVIVTSEMCRGPNIEPANMKGTRDGTGTPHYPWTQVALFGGNFKRGVAFGATTDKIRGIPADFTTGALNQGKVPTVKNVQATILKANGVDPSGWTDARPIDAVLRG